MFNPQRFNIIRDSAFPIEHWGLSPYKNSPYTRSQRTFNFKFSATTMVVEHSFCELKNRFRRCQDVDAKIEKAVNIVISLCAPLDLYSERRYQSQSYDYIPFHCNINSNRFEQREPRFLIIIRTSETITNKNFFNTRNFIAFARR
jgi:hypothetical protein